MLTFSVINGLLVFIVSFFLSMYMIKDNKNIPLISWSLLAIALVYGLGSIVIFNATYNGIDYLRSDVVLFNIDIWPIYGFWVLVLMTGIIFGWKIPVFEKKYINYISKYSIELKEKNFLILAFVLLVLGLVLRWLYVQAFGGFIEYLEYNKAIRSAVFELKNPYSFLQPFGYLVVLSSYIFWALILRKYYLILTILGFILSFIFSLYIYYSFAGRVGFILYLASFIVAYLLIRKFSAKLIIFISALSFPILILIVYFLSLYFNIKGAESPSAFIIKEISFVYVSFFIQLSEGDLYRFFVDFILSPTHFLPSSWTQGLYQTATEVNTALFSGAKKGDQGVTGGIPVDLLTLGLMQSNLVGIFPVGVLFGMVIRRLDYFINLIPYSEIRNILLVFIALRIAFLGVLYSHPEHFTGGLFSFVVLFLIMFVINIFVRLRIG